MRQTNMDENRVGKFGGAAFGLRIFSFCAPKQKMAGKITSDFPDLWAKYKSALPKYEALSAEVIKQHSAPAPLTAIPHGINIETVQIKDIVAELKAPAKDYVRTMAERKPKVYAEPFPWEEIKKLPVGQGISKALGTKNLLGSLWARTAQNITGFKIVGGVLFINAFVGYVTIARPHYLEHPAYKYK